MEVKTVENGLWGDIAELFVGSLAILGITAIAIAVVRALLG